MFDVEELYNIFEVLVECFVNEVLFLRYTFLHHSEAG